MVPFGIPVLTFMSVALWLSVQPKSCAFVLEVIKKKVERTTAATKEFDSWEPPSSDGYLHHFWLQREPRLSLGRSAGRPSFPYESLMQRATCKQHGDFAGRRGTSDTSAVAVVRTARGST
jgi:hypothetical protein